jgi:hypothetical protein
MNRDDAAWSSPTTRASALVSRCGARRNGTARRLVRQVLRVCAGSAAQGRLAPLVVLVGVALVPALSGCVSTMGPVSDLPVGSQAECVVDGERAETPGGAVLMEATESLRRCASYTFEEADVVIAEASSGALYLRWDHGEVFAVDVEDVELVQHVWAQQSGSPAGCAFPGLPPERADVDVPIYLGRGAARPHLSAPGRVYAPGPPGSGACRRVFVGADPVAFATHGVPTGQEGRLVAVENAGGWSEFEHVPTARGSQ